jgi:hypothetical protein
MTLDGYQSVFINDRTTFYYWSLHKLQFLHKLMKKHLLRTKLIINSLSKKGHNLPRYYACSGSFISHRIKFISAQ